MKPRLQLNRRGLPWLVGLLLVLQLATPYQGWLVLLVGLGGGWAISYLWARSLRRGLHLRRTLRAGWTQVGDRLAEEFTLHNRGWARGIETEIQAEANLPDYQASRVVSIDGRSRKVWQVEGVCRRRGLFTLGPTTLRATDPLGLYTLTLLDPHCTTLMVTPRIVQLPEIQVAPGGRAGEGRRRANTLEPTVSAAGIRDYAPGDPAHTLHWPSVARRDILSVRTFDNTPAGDWWIVPDLAAGVQVGEDPDSTQEHAIILAASLAARGLAAGRAVGLVAHGRELAWLPPRLGDQQRWEILRALALLDPGAIDLAPLLNRVRSGIGQFSSLILITPAPSSAWIDALLPFLRRGVVPTVLLLDPATFACSALNGPQGSPEGSLAELARFGIAHYRISSQLLNDHDPVS